MNEPTTITGGEAVPVAVAVPLSNGAGDCALFDPADWQAWLAEGKSACLYLSRRCVGGIAYVTYSANQGRNGYAARWIMKPAKGQVVCYRNRNRNDLRRANLFLRTRRPRRLKQTNEVLPHAD